MHALSDISCKPCNLWCFTYPMTYFKRDCWHFMSSFCYILEENLSSSQPIIFLATYFPCHEDSWTGWSHKYNLIWKSCHTDFRQTYITIVWNTYPLRIVLITVLCDGCMNPLAPELCPLYCAKDLGFKWPPVTLHILDWWIQVTFCFSASLCMSAESHNSTLLQKPENYVG